MCDPSVAGWEHILEFEFIKAISCTYANVVGMLVLGMVVYSAVALSIYIRTGSAVIPTVLLFVTGGATLTQVAPPAYQAATVLILCTGAGAVTYLYYRYSR